MKKLRNDRHGVSNVMGYLFSFAIASMVMVSAVFVTMGIIEDKTSQVAGLEAQSIANYISNSIAEAVAARQSNPDATYEIIWDIPSKIANKNYYIKVTDSTVYVNTTDGRVSRSSSTYTAEELDIGVFSSKTIHGGQGRIAVISDSSDYVYKLDFGSGNVQSHSPVEAGYYFVGGNSLSTLREITWNLDSHSFRVPVRISNPSSNALINVPVQVVLNSSNFDYSKTNVTVAPNGSSAWRGQEALGGGAISNTFISDLRFYDPSPGIVASIDADADPFTWYPHWGWSTSEEVNVTITLDNAPSGMKTDYIDGDTLTWYGGVKSVKCKSYVGGKTVGYPGYAIFDRDEAFKSFGSVVDGETRNVSISGYFKDKTRFTGYCHITIDFGDFYVDDDFGGSTPGWQVTRFDSIQDAIDAADDGETIFVYNGEYNECLTISDNINLVGQSKTGTIIDGTGVSTGEHIVTVETTVTDANITSFTIKKGGYPSGNNGYGLALDGCSGVVVADCDIQDNRGHGIIIWSDGSPGNIAENNIIRDCKSHDNKGGPGGYGHGIILMGPNTRFNHIVDCDFYDNTNYNGNGIYIFLGAHDNLIENCDSYNNKGNAGDGLEIKNYDSDSNPTMDNTIINCSFYGHTGESGDGVDIWTDTTGGDPSPVYASYNQIINCISYGNADEGIGLQYGHNNIIKDCRIYGNTKEGIFIYDEDDSEVINCEIYNNKRDGINISYNSKNNKITYCEIYQNGDDGENKYDGIHIEDDDLFSNQAKNNEIKYCDIHNNEKFGIHLYKAQDNIVQYCDIHDNGNDGLRIRGGLFDDGNITIKFCNFYDNGDDGIELGTLARYIKVTRCNFYCNVGAGIYIGPKYTIPGTKWLTPKQNKIYSNNFANNSNNGYDETWEPEDHNYWDDTVSIGNWWGDFYNGGNWGWPLVYYVVGGGAEPDDYPRGPGHTDPSKRTPWVNPNVIEVSLYTGGIVPLPCGDWFHPCTIQEGIDRVIAGGKVIVTPTTVGGSHSEETIAIDKSVQLIGIDNPTIVNTGGGPVINIVGYKGAPDEGEYKEKVIIDGFGITGGDSGVYVDIQLVMGPSDFPTEISNCEIYNINGNGIYLQTPRNIVTDCEIYNNAKSGIYLDYSRSNNIKSCTITNNQLAGINLSGSNKNNISNCTITNNMYGIHLLDYSAVGSKNNTIKDCSICGQTISNAKHGIYLEGKSKDNVIKQCKIYDIKECGINITGTSTRNKIFSNTFGYGGTGRTSGGDDLGENYPNGLNAFDSAGSNRWNATKANGGGNYWDDYTGLDTNYDGFGDGPRYIPPISVNARDYFPLAVPFEDPNYYRPFSIEYWNPDGNSIILVNVTVNANEEKDIYLYYGSEELTPVSFGSIAEFYDDFNYGGDFISWRSAFVSKWSWSWSEGYDIPEKWWKEKAVTLGFDSTAWGPGYIIKDYPDVIKEPANPINIANTHTASEAMYVVEACIKLNNSKSDCTANQANMILLTQQSASKSYIFSIHANLTTPGNLTLLHKNYGTIFSEKKLDSYDMGQFFDRWRLMKSYIYISKHNYTTGGGTNRTNATSITGFVYDYNTLFNESEVAYIDGYYKRYTGVKGDPPSEPVSNTYDPFLKGRVGIGCGFIDDGNLVVKNTANVTVDWIRVRKTPVVPPVVTVGAMDSINYGWNAEALSINRATQDPFKPGPLLRDSNYHPFTLDFVIKNLASGTYTLAVTKGDNNYDNNNMMVEIRDDNTSYYGLLNFTATTRGSFETKWITIKVDDFTNLILTFIGTGGTGGGGPVEVENTWVVNAITLERGERGIEVTLG